MDVGRTKSVPIGNGISHDFDPLRDAFTYPTPMDKVQLECDANPVRQRDAARGIRSCLIKSEWISEDRRKPMCAKAVPSWSKNLDYCGAITDY